MAIFLGCLECCLPFFVSSLFFLVEGYLKPVPEELKILKEVSAAVFHGEISLGVGVDWLEAETGKSMSRPGLKKYVDKVYGRLENKS